MTYCPRTGHVVLNTTGIVLNEKVVSLKHTIPSDLFVVLDTYKVNPKNLDVKLSEEFDCPEKMNKKIHEIRDSLKHKHFKHIKQKTR